MLEMGRGSGHAWSRAEGPPTPAALSPLGEGPHPQGVRWGSVIAGRALASDRHSGMGAPRPPASSPRERQRGPWTPCSRWASPSWELHTVGRKGAPGVVGEGMGVIQVWNLLMTLVWVFPGVVSVPLGRRRRLF